MKKNQLFLSTIAPDAAEEARRHGLGLEIAEYCTAWNMDEQFETTHAAVTEELTGVGRRLLHAPFSELFPCAVDRKPGSWRRSATGRRSRLRGGMMPGRSSFMGASTKDCTTPAGIRSSPLFSGRIF